MMGTKLELLKRFSRRARHFYRVFNELLFVTKNRLRTLGENERKPIAIIYGNCVADLISSVFTVEPQFCRRFETVYFRSFDDPVSGPPVFPEEHIERCELLLEQRGPFQHAPFLSQLSPQCRVISFPMLHVRALWPYYVYDGLNQPEPESGFPFGRFPYGDQQVKKWIREGAKPAEIAHRYESFDLDKEVNLDRLWTQDLEIGRELDAKCTVGCYDFIGARFQEQRLFWTPDHPTGQLLLVLINRVFSAVGMNPMSNHHAQYLVDKDPLSNNQLPIHPKIMSFFRLSWASRDMRYRYHGREWLSYNEYFERYAEFLKQRIGSF